MSERLTAKQALAFIKEYGVVLVSAKGPAPCLTEAIIGEHIKGSWWGHAQGNHIFGVLEVVTESDQVLVCRLVGGKITLVHRRLWPSLVRLAGRFAPEQLAQVHQDHTTAGRHVNREVPFPLWVPADVMEQAKTIDEEQALAAFGAWVTSLRPAAKKKGRGR